VSQLKAGRQVEGVAVPGFLGVPAIMFLSLAVSANPDLRIEDILQDVRTKIRPLLPR
jgi:hypothetical protein